ncbi:MAG: formylglycine-generating enzyme family protein, partial [Planctomycetota bacterium]
DFNPERDAATLRTIETLRSINGIPVAEFWKKYPARPRELAKERTLDLGGGVRMEFVLVNAGEFQMGAQEGELQERPAHRVKISNPFYLGKYEVTQAQYEKVVGRNPSKFKGADLPVEQVSWDEAQTFCGAAGKLAGRSLRLPTEAEWEYACRAGTTTKFNTGGADSDLEDAAWFNKNSRSHTNPVGQRKPNAWGLYDMHGNVWEWVQDHFSEKYYVESPVIDPEGPQTGAGRVLRGGCWRSSADDCRSACRHKGYPGERYEDAGFRAVLDF